MNPTHHKQRLTAILAADAAGYSRLMGADAQGTVHTLDAARAIFLDQITRWQGRVIDMAGDSVLAVFETAVGAASAALAIQQNLCAAAAELPEDRRMLFRIGLHLGDVIEKPDGSIYGDGVNIAARLQSLADPGQISVSDAIYGVVRGKLDASFEDRGEHPVKNIAYPVRLFCMHLPDATMPLAHGSVAVPAHRPAAIAAKTQHRGPSIAVLPFTNMSGDAEQEYFSDGISEDIITDLCKIGGLMVVARNSSFAYKNKSTDIRVVGSELGVSAVLEGSIRRAGNRVRITAQLIDAATGGHLWAERFDREITDIFAVQDEVTRQIVNALQVTLHPADQVLMASSRARNVQAHDAFLLGRELLLGANKTREVFERVVSILQRAIELDPEYAQAYGALGMAHCHDFQNHWSGRSDAQELSNHYVALAIDKGPSEPYVHYVAAVVAFWNRDLERAILESNTALRLSPNYALAYGTLGLSEIYIGRPLAALPHLQRAITLDPVFAQQYWHFLGSAYLLARDFEAAVHAFQERIRLAPRTDLSRAFLASAFGHLGRLDEARQVWQELMAINPKYVLAEHLARLPFRHEADRDCIRQGLDHAAIDL